MEEKKEEKMEEKKEKPKEEKVEYSTMHIDFPVCFKCGELFGAKDLRKTKHHVIPQLLEPKRNITIPLHAKCHAELNGLYIHQKKKPKSSKSLKVFTNRMEGLRNSYKKFGKKIEKVYSDYMEEIQRVEDGDK